MEEQKRFSKILIAITALVVLELAVILEMIVNQLANDRYKRGL